MSEGHGADHTVTTTAEGTLVRRRRPGAEEGLPVEAEAALLALVARHSPLPVPRVLRVWPDDGALEMDRVPGVALLGWLDSSGHAAPALVEGWAAALGGLVAALADVPERLVAALVPRDDTTPADHLAEIGPTVARLGGELPAELRRRVDAFVATPAPAAGPRGVLCHGDLGAEHVFVDPERGAITGVIDWSDAALTDPALDLGLLLRDLGPGAYRRARVETRLADPDLDVRARFFARVRAIEDLAYGIDEGEELYRRNATRALAVLFDPGSD